MDVNGAANEIFDSEVLPALNEFRKAYIDGGALSIQHAKSLSRSVLRLTEEIKSNPAFEKLKFYTLNNEQLYDLRATMMLKRLDISIVESVRSNPSVRKMLASAIDKLWHSALECKRLERVVNFRSTRIFNGFMKGITFFGIDMANPSYHRDDSCGPRFVSIGDEDDDEQRRRAAYKAYENFKIARYVCVGNEENSRRRRLVYMCYLERLVYDHIYRRITGTNQNFGHRYELKHMSRLFSECYPTASLNIEVFYSARDTTRPVQLVIRLDDGDASLIERYVHYGDHVDCERINNNGSSVFKQQTPEQENPWPRTINLLMTRR